MELEHPADNEASTAERLIGGGGGGAAGVKERARALNSTGAFHASKCRFCFLFFFFFTPIQILMPSVSGSGFLSGTKPTNYSIDFMFDQR